MRKIDQFEVSKSVMFARGQRSFTLDTIGSCLFLYRNVGL